MGTPIRRWHGCEGLCLALAVLAGGCTDDDGGETGGSGGSGGTDPTIPDTGAIIPCPPGELPLTDGSCLAPGIPADGCGPGFEPDAQGGCIAIEPAAPCAPGMMALLGETTCRAVEPCPTTTWADVPTDPSTQYVDAAYTGGSSNGTQTNPWVTVQQGVDAAGSGATVAIAAGTYAESVTIGSPLVLRGTCAGEVLIDGGNGTAVTVTSSGVEVRGLALTTGSTSAMGAYIDGAEVLLDRVWVHDTGTIGVYAGIVGGPATVTLRDSLVEGATVLGVAAVGADLVVEDSVVRDTAWDGDGNYGRGIEIDVDGTTGTAGTAQLRGVKVERNHQIGIMAFGATATVENTLVRATTARQDGRGGTGIEGTCDQLGTHLAAVSLFEVVVEDARQCGVCTYASDLTAEHVVVRDVHSEDADQGLGMGIQVWADRPGPPRPQATISAAIIERTHTLGLGVVGADATVSSLVVRDISAPALDGIRGDGVAAIGSFETQEGASVELTGSSVERATEVGVVSFGSHLAVDSVWVHDTQPRAADGAYGAGVVFHQDVLFTGLPADGQVSRTVVEDCRAAGIVALGADLQASDVIVRNTLPMVGEFWGDGLVASSYLVEFSLQHAATMDVARATIEDSVRAGVANFGAVMTVTDSLLECNTIHLNREEIMEAPATLVNGGGNACRCQVDEECKVVSSGLEPPPGLLGG